MIPSTKEVNNEAVLEIKAANVVASKIVTPFGLPRIILLISYLVVICVTGMAVGAADPLIEMLRLSGALSHLENEAERTSAFSSAVGLGMSFTALSGLAMGPFIQLFGSKIVAVVGIVLHVAGYACFFLIGGGQYMWLLILGGSCFGIAFQCIINAHLSAGCLYPSQANLIVGMVGAAPDLSYFLPPLILTYALKLGGGSEGVQQAVQQYLLFFVVPSILLAALLVPWKPYRVLKPSSSTEVKLLNRKSSLPLSSSSPSSVVGESDEVRATENTALIERKLPQEDGISVEDEQLPSQVSRSFKQSTESEVLRLSVLSSKAKGRSTLGRKDNEILAAGPFWHLSAPLQLRTADYWIFLPIFLVTFLRRKHYFVFLRPTLAEMATTDEQLAQADSLMTLYNLVVPYGFVTAILWGGLVDIFGFIGIVFASVGLGVINTVLLTIPILPLHYLTIGLVIIQHSFVMGLCMAFCVTYYGLDTISTLQGVATFVVGISALVMDFFWPSFVVNTLQSFRLANFVVLGIGVLLLAFPVSLFLRQRRRNKH